MAGRLAVRLAVCIVMRVTVGGAMYSSGEPIGLEAAKDDVCWSEGLSAAYVTGKAFEIFMGPSVLAGRVDKSIPYMQDVRISRTYSQVMPTSLLMLCAYSLIVIRATSSLPLESTDGGSSRPSARHAIFARMPAIFRP